MLRAQLARRSWDGEPIAIGAATDPYQPAEGRYRLTRACLEVLARRRAPVLDHHARAADRARRRRARRGRAPRGRLGHVLGADARRRGLARDRAGHRAAAAAAARAVACSSTPACAPRSGWRRSSPASPTIRDQLERVVDGRARGRRVRHLGEPPLPQAGHARALPRRASPATGRSCCRSTSASTHGARTSPRRTPRRPATRSRELARAHGIRDRRPEPLRPPPSAEQLSLLSRATRIARNGRRDHDPDRRRPRGRPRRPAALALARAAHPRRRRGRRRRSGGRAGGAAQARRRDHGRPHAGHGRARGDEAADRAGARVEGADLHRLLRALAAQPRARVGREGLHPQGGAAPDARARDREGRRRARATSTRR